MYLAPAQNIYRMTGLLVTNKLPSGENAHNVHLYVDGINNHEMIKRRNRNEIELQLYDASIEQLCPNKIRI